MNKTTGTNPLILPPMASPEAALSRAHALVSHAAAVAGECDDVDAAILCGLLTHTLEDCGARPDGELLSQDFAGITAATLLEEAQQILGSIPEQDQPVELTIARAQLLDAQLHTPA